MRITNLIASSGLTAAILSACLMGGCEATPDRIAQEPRPSALDHALRDVPLEEAQAKADAEDRVLLVFGTADWCGPCQRMKADTWTDPNVGEWVEQHARILYLDVDDHGDVATTLEISGIPHIIAYRNGEEIARTSGYRNGDAFLEWLRNMKG